MAQESVILGGITALRQWGFFDFLMPFLLFFAMTYAILGKSKIFSTAEGGERKDINALVAFVIAIISATTTWILASINAFIPWLAFIMLAILGFLIVGSMVYGKDITEIFFDITTDASGTKTYKLASFARWIAVGVGILIFLIALYALNLTKYLSMIGFGTMDMALVLIIAVGVGMTYFVLKDE